MLIVNEVLPMLDVQFVMLLAVGLAVYLLSTRCRAALVAERLQVLAFCGCATGSITILQSLARIYRH